MEGARCKVSQTQSFVDIQILIVDDDATSLAVVSAMLRICKYRVVGVKNPVEALKILRAKKGFFDLVVTDLHMPQMDGLQLHEQIKQEFNLPVIIISADEKPDIILKSLEEGVALYMVKPVSLDDLKHVWQYAITARHVNIRKSCFEAKSTNSKNRKAAKKAISNKNSTHIIRNPKVVWTNSLHNRFLHAIKQIGLDKAVPKRILEFMDVPGLTRENVASHLQKYRIFLKRVAEKGSCSVKGLSVQSKLLQSNFASAHFSPQIFKQKFQSQYPFPPKIHQIPQSLNYPQLNPKPNFTMNSIASSRTQNEQNNLTFMVAENYGFLKAPNGLNNGGEQQRVHTWEESSKSSTFEVSGEEEDFLGDVNLLSEVLMDHNYGQRSNLQKKEEEIVGMEISHKWNQTELDDLPKESFEHQTLFQPQLQPQDWDDEVLEFLFGNNSS